MKYAHLADCHIGSWRDPKLKDITTQAFCKSIDLCISENVDFILISGDLFNTSLPALDLLKIVTKKLKEVKDKGIPIYGIAGSHDYSPSGKTMLDVLGEAGLWNNVAIGEFNEETQKLDLRFTIDPKTNTKITGVIGKKGGLEKEYFHYLDQNKLEQEPGYKIFLFHTALTELKPDHLREMEANPISLLPKNFNYYAGGHVHIVKHANLEGYKNVVYPGPLFPNSFSELEKLDCGGFYMIETNGQEENVKYIPVIIHPIVNLEVDSDYKTPDQVTSELLNQTNRSFENAIVTIRLKGILREGSIADIDFRKVFDQVYENKAHFVMKNTAKLNTRQLEQVMVSSENLEQIEHAVIAEHIGQATEFKPEIQKQLALSLLQALATEKDDGQRIIDFEEMIVDDVDKVVQTSTKEINQELSKPSL